MVHQERLEIGEKCFVSAIMAVLATEAALTVITNGMHFSWLGLLLGVAGFWLIMFLANRIYAGSRQAHAIALAWVAFQIAYAVCVLLLRAFSREGRETALGLGAPAVWPVVLKGLVYVYLGWVLLRMPTVRDFFAEKRGEAMAHTLALNAPVPQTPSPTVELTAEHASAARELARYMRLAAGALVLLGALQVMAAVVGPGSMSLPGLLYLAQGALTIVLGAALGAPASELRPLAGATAPTKRQLVGALGSLGKFYRVQVAVGLLLAVVLAARIVSFLG